MTVINVLCDAQKSLVSTSSTEISKQQHCKNGPKMSTDLNIEMVTELTVSHKRLPLVISHQQHDTTLNKAISAHNLLVI